MYYEILLKSRPMGGKAKDLILEKKEIETEVATLTNAQTGSVLILPACEKVQKPNKPFSFFYPDFAGVLFNEVEEFKKDPFLLPWQFHLFIKPGSEAAADATAAKAVEEKAAAEAAAAEAAAKAAEAAAKKAAAPPAKP